MGCVLLDGNLQIIPEQGPALDLGPDIPNCYSLDPTVDGSVQREYNVIRTLNHTQQNNHVRPISVPFTHISV